VAGETILACLPNMRPSLNGAWACVIHRPGQPGLVSLTVARDEEDSGGIAQRDHARGRCRKLRRLTRRRTALVRLAPAAPADCDGEPACLRGHKECALVGQFQTLVWSRLSSQNHKRRRSAPEYTKIICFRRHWPTTASAKP